MNPAFIGPSVIRVNRTSVRIGNFGAVDPTLASASSADPIMRLNTCSDLTAGNDAA